MYVALYDDIVLNRGDMSYTFIISPKFESFGGIMFLVPPPSPPPPPPPHANACTGHNVVTNTPIKFIFAIAIEVPDNKNPMIFVINRKNKMASEMARNAIESDFRTSKMAAGYQYIVNKNPTK